ncbi:MAG: hypothetical protein HKL96_13060 [Phycisphaerales bacterium]|nr:hypothetical protein [Phycisphaerales bacterium]
MLDGAAQWAVVGGFVLALAGSLVTVIGFVVSLQVTQHDHGKRLQRVEDANRDAALKMERMEQGIAVLLERTRSLAAPSATGA